ncbi:MAG: hypothetical protein LC754_11290 [Acidobacteria bacterium]|nr:hypothetical protein [Acidobacteriota bacterium]
MPLKHLTVFFIIALLLSASTGCSKFIKKKVTVPPVLTPLLEADTAKLIEEINRQAALRSLSGKVDLQFLDTSFAECGLVEKFRTAEGSLVAQRDGQIYLAIQAPFGIKIAEMSSDGEHFWVALYQGDEKYRRFVQGTNNAVYRKLDADGAKPRCDGGGEKQLAAMQRATVSTLSSLRPHHFTDALLLRPITTENSNLIYAQAESFEEEPDTRVSAKKGARVVRGYYVLSELEPQGANRARVLRRFWFDRIGDIRLARVQTYDEGGALTTDVVYGATKSFGEGGVKLPSIVELTRPHDSYSIRMSFQQPEAAKVNQPFDRDIFVLKNTSNLPEVNLDAQKK